MKEMKNNHADELIAAYLAGDISAPEEQQLMAWVKSSSDNQKFFDQAINIWQAADEFIYPDFSANTSAAFKRLDDRLEQESTKSATIRSLTPMRRIKPWLRIAAAVLFLIGAAWWWQGQEAKPVTFVAQTQHGIQQTVTLPDGTIVRLNEASELSYEGLAEARVVRFQGEAYFEVVTDSVRPFRVYTGQAVTTVLGTAFNLRAYPDEPAVELSVTEGRVALEVAQPEQTVAQPKRVELTAGKIGVYERESEEVQEAQEVSVQNKLAWKEQVLNFDGVPLRQAIQDLERYFDVEITVEQAEMLDCTLQVSEYQKPKLEEMLSILQFSLEFDINHAGDQILLSGGQCQ